MLVPAREGRWVRRQVRHDASPEASVCRGSEQRTCGSAVVPGGTSETCYLSWTASLLAIKTPSSIFGIF